MSGLDELEKADADVVILTAPASDGSFWDREIIEEQSAAVLLLSDQPIPLQSRLRTPSRSWGILPLEASAGELIAAVHALSEGLIVGMIPLIFPQPPDQTPSEPTPLTPREVEVLALLAKGMANKQISVALGISEHTVKFHVSSIYAKLNVTNRTEAVRAGLRSGWIAL